MIFRFRQLIGILRFLMFHVKHHAYMASKQRHKSTHNLHLLAVFFLLGFCAFNLSSIETQAKQKLDISKITLNSDTLTETSPGQYSGTVSGGPSLDLVIYSDFENLTDYNLKATITFTYPQSVNSYLNITPFKQTSEQGVVYLAEIGKVTTNSNQLLSYHTKAYYTDNQPNVPPFHHGGYLSPPFGGSYTTQTINTEFAYYFNQNEHAKNIGINFETGGPGTLSSFASMSRYITVTIDYLDAVEKATIENAETTKNIFEWLQDGFVNLIVPTSDGIEEMLDETSNTLESRLGILYLPIRFAGQLLGVLTASLEGAVSGQSITVPQWNMSLFGHDYIIWHQTTFSMTDNAIFHYIVFDLGLIFLVRLGYLLAMFTSIILTINTCTDNMVDEEFAHFMTAEERDMWLNPLQTYNHDDDEGGGDF